MTMKISSNLLRLLNESKSFLIVGHINPEGDSIGSCIALALGLKKLGKRDVCVLSRDPVPETLRFLPSSRIIRQTQPRKRHDLVILVDCNDPLRTGFREFNARKIVIIDHHVLSSDGDLRKFYNTVSASMIDPDAAATGVLIYKILTSLKISIDKNIATNLYAAILVDTGGFRYSNADPDSLMIAANLVRAGAKPWNITREIYESIPYRSMKLLGLSLATLEKEDGIAWITTRKDMMKRTGSTSEDCEDFVDFPRKVKDVEVAVFFRQDSPKSFKISLRSKGNVNVQKIAGIFGGGGHAAAAGCKIEGNLKEVQARVFRAVKQAIRTNQRKLKIKNKK